MIFTRSNRCLSLLTRTHYPINQIRTQRLFTTDNIKPDVQSKDETEASESISPLEEKEREIAQLKDGYRRCLADMENLRNRTLKEVENAKIFSVQKFAKDLLTTSDTLAICLKATPSSLLDTNSALKNLYDGVIMTQKTLDACFKRFGMSQYDPIGEKFDPNLHEALFKVKIDGKKSGTVFQTSQTGYMIHGRVIRPAQVGVVADSDDDDDEKQNGKDQDK